MAQNSFGRRYAPSQAAASSAGSSADGSSKAVVLSSAAASFLAFAALGYFLTPSGATRVDAALPKIADTRPAPAECRGKPNCKNEYSVDLRCGESDVPKTTSVVASSAEAAGVTAERYNRGCRTHRAFFLAVITHGVSGTSRVAAKAPAAKAPRRVRSFRGGRRFRRR